MSSQHSFVGKIKNLFEDKKQLSVQEIYTIIVIQTTTNKSKPMDLKHKVRSSIYSLQKQGVIKRIDAGIYSIIE